MAPGVVVCWSGSEPRMQTLRIPAEGLILGRDHASATDERISRRHVQVRIADGAVHVQDLGSRNGTFVDGRENPESIRMPFSVVIRAGRTVFVVVPDVRIYEDLHEGKVGAAMERARREIEDAARAEQNVTIEAGHANAMTLVRRYMAVFGGTELLYRPTVDTPVLDDALAGTRPRVVALDLSSHALSFTDMPTVNTWLETDVRFLTVMWPGANVLSMVDPSVVARLRERVIEVANPRCDELPVRVSEIVSELRPDARIHATTIEGMLLRARQYDEEWVVPRFRKAVANWQPADPSNPELRFRDLVHEIDPPATGAYCLDGSLARRRSSF